MIRQIRNLNLIFWGILIVIIDFSFSSTTNGHGIKFDIINDFVGSILIFIGLSKISKIKLNGTSFKSKMNYSLVASFMHILHSISDFFIYPTPEYISTIKNLLDIVINWGFVTFSGAMIVLTTETHLNNSLRRWITTIKIFIWIYFLPFAALTFISEIISLINTYRYNWTVEFGLKGTIGTLGLIVILLLPITYGLFTMYCMKNEIKQKH